MKNWTVIGVSGQFGQFMAEFLLKNNKNVLGVSRSKPDKQLLKNKNFSYLAGDASKQLAKPTIAAIQQTDAVLFSVPIAITDLCIRKVGPFLQPGQLVTDVTSVKIIPVKAMLQHVSERVEVLGMHPMFSPTLSLKNKNVILVPERIVPEKLSEIIEMYEKQKANVSIMTAKEHDQMVAVFQALSHFVMWSFGLTLVDNKWDFAATGDKETTFYTLLKSLLGRVLSFDPDLYAQIQLYNPEAPKILKAFLKSAYKLQKSIDTKRELDLKKTMQKIIAGIPVDKNIIEKTNKMYSILENK